MKKIVVFLTLFLAGCGLHIFDSGCEMHIQTIDVMNKYTHGNRMEIVAQLLSDDWDCSTEGIYNGFGGYIGTRFICSKCM